jgi:hypothetical protein
MNESINRPRSKRKLLMTEQQFNICLEHHIKNTLIEGKKKALLEKLNDEEWRHPGQIVTFKQPYPDLPNRKFAVHSLEKDKNGRIRLLNKLGLSTPWFETSEALVSAIDWDWMTLNTILAL